MRGKYEDTPSPSVLGGGVSIFKDKICNLLVKASLHGVKTGAKLQRMLHKCKCVKTELMSKALNRPQTPLKAHF